MTLLLPLSSSCKLSKESLLTCASVFMSISMVRVTRSDPLKGNEDSFELMDVINRDVVAVSSGARLAQ